MVALGLVAATGGRKAKASVGTTGVTWKDSPGEDGAYVDAELASMCNQLGNASLASVTRAYRKPHRDSIAKARKRIISTLEIMYVMGAVSLVEFNQAEHLGRAELVRHYMTLRNRDMYTFKKYEQSGPPPVVSEKGHFSYVYPHWEC